jgi:hypothetical protein
VIERSVFITCSAPIWASERQVSPVSAPPGQRTLAVDGVNAQPPTVLITPSLAPSRASQAASTAFIHTAFLASLG